MRRVKRVLALVGAPVIFGIGGAAHAALVTGWGAETGATGGTVTDDTVAIAPGDFHTSTPTGNLAPRALLPSTLTLTNVGDQIVLSGQVALASGDNGNESFRFGLFNSNGANTGTLTGGVWTGSTDTAWLGYIVELGNLAGSSGTDIIDRHNNPNTSAWFSTSANATILNSVNVNPQVLNAAATYNFSMTLTLASATSIGISYSVADTGGHVNLTGSTTDTSPAPFSFNSVGFLENTTSGGAATYSNVDVSFVPAAIPEPASLGLLGLAGAASLRRRRCR